MDEKYIVIDAGGQELMFRFPNEVTHAWMMDAIQSIKQGLRVNWTRPYRNAKAISAGFISKAGFCYGESETLEIGSRHTVDTALLWQRGSLDPK